MARVACLFPGIIPRDLPRLGSGLWLSSPSREETGFAFTCRTILVQSLHMLTPFFLHCHPALPDPVTSHMLGHFWPEASYNQPPLGKARSPQAFLKRLHVVSPISVRAVPPLGELPFSSLLQNCSATQRRTQLQFGQLLELFVKARAARGASTLLHPSPHSRAVSSRRCSDKCVPIGPCASRGGLWHRRAGFEGHFEG